MDYKKEFKRLLEIVREKRLKADVPARNEDLAKMMGYNRSYFSTLLGDNGVIGPEHVKMLILLHPWLRDQTKFKLEDVLDNPTSTSNDSIRDKKDHVIEKDEAVTSREILEEIKAIRADNSKLISQQDKLIDNNAQLINKLVNLDSPEKQEEDELIIETLKTFLLFVGQKSGAIQNLQEGRDILGRIADGTFQIEKEVGKSRGVGKVRKG